MKSSAANRAFVLEALLFFSVLMLYSAYGVSAAGNFNCSIMSGGSCGGDNLTILYMENDTGGYMNAHAQNVSVGTYAYAICCNSSSSIVNVCGQGIFLKLNATTNTHVQRGDYNGPSIIYGVDACVSASPGYFNCTYVDDSCPADRECVASMASSNVSAGNNTDCHVGPCSEYRKKVCCKVIPAVEVTYESPTPGNNTREVSNSVTINVSVSTDSGVSADTCILEWKVNEGAPANETMTMRGSGSEVTCDATKVTNDGTNYTFRVYANDSVGSLASEGARTFRENDEPAQVSLTSPAEGEETTDRTPAFSWSEPSDADGDSLKYAINITCLPSGCSDDDRYVTEIGTTSYTPSQELKYFGDDNYYYNWSVHAYDPYENGSWSSLRNFTVETNVTVTLLNDNVDFGENRIPGYSDDTSDGDPAPFQLRNTGNCMIDVNITSEDLLWDAVTQPSDYFNYSVAWYSGEEGAFNWSGSQTSWANMPEVDQNVTFIDYLNYSSGNSTAEIEIYIKVPPAEPPGTKSSSIAFVGEYHKP